MMAYLITLKQLMCIYKANWLTKASQAMKKCWAAPTTQSHSVHHGAQCWLGLNNIGLYRSCGAQNGSHKPRQADR